MAVEAFGAESRIEGEIPNLQIAFRGAHPASGLAQDFCGRTGVLVAPCDPSESYELLLGGPFLEDFRAAVLYGDPGKVQSRCRRATA